MAYCAPDCNVAVEKTGGESPQMVGGFTIGFPGKAGACESEFVEGELIVKFKEGFSPENALEGKVDYEKIEKVFSKSTGGGKQKVKESKEEKALSRTHRVIIDKKADIKKVAEDLEALPGVEYAEPNYIRYPTMVPNDPYFSSVNSWGQGYDDLWGIKKISSPSAWDLSQGEGVVVAVVDTGVDYTHPDLSANMWRNPGEIPGNGIDDEGNGYVDDVYGYDFGQLDSNPMDYYGHGTHCAGTIAGTGNNGIGVIGVAPNAKIMAAKGFPDDASRGGTDFALGSAVIYAVNNDANVLSNSWGGGGTSNFLTDVFHYAESRGVVAVAAAGNNSADVSGFTPASIDTVLAVSASTQNDELAYFSNYGNRIDVAAPGGGYASSTAYSVYNILSTMSNSQFPAQLKVANGYYRLAGTSMATPHVSGVAALVLANNRGLSPLSVRQSIRLNADDIGPAGKDIRFGCGRVNAFRAVEEAGNFSVSITSPVRDSFLTGDVAIVGSATFSGFQKYEIHLVPEEGPGILLSSSTTQVEDGLLGTLHSTSYTDGPYTLLFRAVSAGCGDINYSVPVTIDNYNQAPEFVNLTDKFAVIGKALEFSVTARDADNPATPWGRIVYSASGLPAGAQFNTQTGFFSWTASEQQKGEYSVAFTISDSEYSATKTVNIPTAYVTRSTIVSNLRYSSGCEIDGDNIMWTASNNLPTDQQVFVYDIRTGQTRQITSLPTEILWPADIYGNQVAYHSLRINYLTLQDLATGSKTNLASGDAEDLQFYGSNIFYVRYAGSKGGHVVHQLFRYNLSAGGRKQTSQLTKDATDKRGPAVSGNRVAFYAGGTLQLYDLSTLRITTIDSGSVTTMPAIEGNIVVWGGRYSPYDFTQAFAYDFSTRKKTMLWPYPNNQLYSAVHGNKVVWYNQDESGNGSLYLYDFDLNIASSIVDNVLPTADIVWPRMAGNKVVFLSHDPGSSSPNGKLLNFVRFYLVPEITSISSTALTKGARATIQGKNFAYEQGTSTLQINGLNAEITGWSDQEITFNVPRTASSGMLTVTTPGGSSSIAVTVK